MNNLYDFLKEAADQRDQEDTAQGVITVIGEGLRSIYGYVDSVTPELLSLERIKFVNNVGLGHVSLHPYLHHFPMGKIVMVHYVDLREVPVR